MESTENLIEKKPMMAFRHVLVHQFLLRNVTVTYSDVDNIFIQPDVLEKWFYAHQGTERYCKHRAILYAYMCAPRFAVVVNINFLCLSFGSRQLLALLSQL